MLNLRAVTGVWNGVMTSYGMSVSARASFRALSTQNICTVDNPYSGKVYASIPFVGEKEANDLLSISASAQKVWRNVPLSERMKVCEEFMAHFETQRDKVAQDITGQMGKPLRQSQNEVNGMYHRVKGMLRMAPEVLADEIIQNDADGFRQITKEPVGIVFVIAPWNYPLLTAINAIIPAVLAGNSVVIKHSNRTPLCAEHFADAFAKTSAPKGLVTALQADHDVVHKVIADERIGFVSFTGSVDGGHKVYESVAKRFIDATLELGGKDPAYVAPDANLQFAAEGLIDGAFYNAGQSCCGIERVYVHKSVYEEFLKLSLPIVKGYVLGDPMDANTSLGPVAQPHHVAFLHSQVKRALEKGARLLCGGGPCTDSHGLGRFFAPTLLAECTHSMDIMTEESFGPVLGVMPVNDEEEAIEMMNDSHYGLTAAIYTSSKETAARMAPRIQTGTVFMNRCDALDPDLPWTGVKDTGKGISLSRHGFRGATKLKGYNFRVKI